MGWGGDLYTAGNKTSQSYFFNRGGDVVMNKDIILKYSYFAETEHFQSMSLSH